MVMAEQLTSGKRTGKFVLFVNHKDVALYADVTARSEDGRTMQGDVINGGWSFTLVKPEGTAPGQMTVHGGPGGDVSYPITEFAEVPINPAHLPRSRGQGETGGAFYTDVIAFARKQLPQ